MRRIFDILSQRTGVDFSNYKTATIQRRLEKRLHKLKIDSLDEYIKRLEKDPHEVEEMFQVILIGVTRFFRDKKAFDYVEKVLTKIIEDKKPGSDLRMWIPGCSTGEEAYSLAILADRILKQKDKSLHIQVFATDIDNRALEIARKGKYKLEALELVDKKTKQNYFIKKGKQFELLKDIRSMVLFSRHDVTQNPPFLRLDFISCRNLFIYFNSGLQQQLLSVFHFALNDPGYLFLGKSESIGSMDNMFSVTDSEFKVFKRRTGNKNSRVLRFSGFKSQKSPNQTGFRNQMSRGSLMEAIRDQLISAFDYPYAIIDDDAEVREVHGDVRPYLTLPQGVVRMNLLKMINPELRVEFRALFAKVLKTEKLKSGKVKRFELYGKEHFVRLIISPIHQNETDAPLYLVIFELPDIKGLMKEGIVLQSQPDDDEALNSRLTELEDELASTREHLQSQIEQLEIANEELQSLNEELESANEEYNSTNEELEASNEELQSSYEEINAAYAQLADANSKLKQNRENLKQREANMKALLNNKLQAMALLNNKGEILSFNERAGKWVKRFAGVERPTDKNLLEILPDQVKHQFKNCFNLSLDGNVVAEEIRIKDNDGREFWFALNCTPVYVDKGNVTGISMALLDISELKTALTGLTEKQRLIESVFEAAEVGLCVTDQNACFVDVNRKFSEIYGYSKTELIGESIGVLAPHGMEKEYIDSNKRFLAGVGTESVNEFKVVKKNSEEVFIEAAQEQFFKAGGKRYLVTSVRDITQERDVKLREVEVRQLLQRSELLSDTGSWELDVVTEKIRLSSQMAKMLNVEFLTDRGGLGLILKYTHPEDRKRAEKIYREAVENKTTFEFEQRIIDAEGNEKIIAVSGLCEQKEETSTPKLYTAFRDVTEERLIRHQLESITDNMEVAVFKYHRPPSGPQDDYVAYLNRGAKKLWGIEPDDIISGKNNIWEMIHPDDLEYLKDSVSKSAEKLTKWKAEWRVDVSGNIKWQSGVGIPKKLHDGTVSWDVMIYDITPQKTAQEKLKKVLCDVKERVKEQTCLYKISGMPEQFKTGTIFKRSCTHIKKGFQYSDIAEVSISCNGYAYSTPGFKKASSQQSISASSKAYEDEVLSIEVFYSQKEWNGKEVEFFNEEKKMLDSIADLLAMKLRQKRAHELVNETKDQLQKIMNQSLDMICTFDKEGRFVHVSRASEQILGYTADEMIGKSYKKFVDPSCEEKADNINEEVLSGKEVRDFENIFVKKNCDRVPLTWSARWDERDELMYCVAKDATEINKTMDALKNAKEEVQTLIQSVDGIVWEANPKDFDFEYVSEQVRDILGYSPADWYAEADFWKNHIHPEDKKEAVRYCKVETNACRDHRFEYRMRKKDGSYIWIHDRVNVICDENGKPETLRGIMLDITDAKEREKELMLLESVVTNAKDLIVITEANLLDQPGPRITYVNDSLVKLTGYSREEMVGNSPRILQGSATQKSELKRIKTALKNETEVEAQLINYTKTGEPYWIEMAISPVHDADGKCTHFIAIERDITHIKMSDLNDKAAAEIGNIFNKEAELPELMTNVLEAFAQYGHFQIGEMWMLNADETELQLAAKYSSSGSEHSFYKAGGDEAVFAKGKGLPGTVWENKEFTHWTNLKKKKEFVRKKAIKNTALDSACGIPVIHAEKVIGVLLFGWERNIEQCELKVTIPLETGERLGTEIRRKQAEKELHQIFTSSKDIICIIDQNNRFKKVNPAAEETLGHELSKLITRHFTYYVHSEDLEKTQNELSTVRTQNRVRQFENRYQTATGELRRMEWTLTPDSDSDLIFGIGRDITEKRELELLLDKASDLSNIGAWERNLVTGKVHWSQKTKEILGAEEKFESDFSNPFPFVFDSETRKMMNRLLNRAEKKGEVWDKEIQIKTAGGDVKWIRTIGEPEMADGKCMKIVGSLQDISAAKHAEMALKQRTEYLSAISKINGMLLHYKDTLKAVNESMKLMGETVKADRVYYFEVHEEVSSQKAEWCNKGVEPQIDNPDLQNVPFDAVPGFVKPLKNNKAFCNKVSKIKDDSTREVLEAQEVKSILVLPIFIREEFRGFIGFDDCVEEREWSKEERSFLESITNTVAAALEKDLASRKLAEAYKERNTILESITDAFYAVNQNWMFTYFNHEAERLLGVNSEEVKEQYIWDVFPKAAKTNLKEFYEEVIVSGNASSLEYFYPGNEKWFEINAYPSEHGFSVYFKDITERRKAVEEIRQSNERFRKVAEAAGEAIWEYNFETDRFFWGEGFKKLFGYEIEGVEYSLEDWNKLVHPDDLPQVVDSYEKAWEDKTAGSWEEEYRLKKTDGTYAHVIDRGGIIRDAQGVPTKGVGTLQDVTERKKYVQQIKESNLRFEMVTEATNDAIWDWNIKKGVLYRGKGFDRLFGYKSQTDKCALKNTAKSAHPDDKNRIHKSLQKALENPKQTYWQFEYRFKRNDGQYSFIIDRAYIIRDENGKALRMVGAMQDITQRKEYEESLEQLNNELKQQAHELSVSNRELEQFAYVASHDLQEPLRMITGFMTQLEKKYGNELDDKAHKYINYAVDGAMRMKQIILDLLEYSRVGRTDEGREVVDLNKIVKDVQDLNRKLIQEKGAKIKAHQLPVLKIEDVPMRQVFRNLIGNALKYSHPDRKPKIEISCERKEKELQFSVKDNGLGIEKDYHDKVFLIFQTLHSKEKYGGTGVGLALTKKIIETYGGSLKLQSEPNKGSTFIFTLPVELLSEK